MVCQDKEDNITQGKLLQRKLQPPSPNTIYRRRGTLGVTVVVAFICEASVLADLWRRLGRKERLAGVCVWCVWIAEERQVCIFNERVRMDFQEVEWKLRARLQHAQSVRRERAVLEKLRTEKDNLRLLPRGSRRAGPVVQQQQQGVCGSRLFARRSVGGVEFASSELRQAVPPHEVPQQQQQWSRGGGAPQQQGCPALPSQPRRPAP